MFGIEGIEAVKFAPGVLGVEPPVNGGSGGISLRDQGLDLPPEGGFVGDALLEAGAGQHAELDFRHIQPTPVLGGVVELQPFGDPAGLGAAGKVSYREAVLWVFRLSRTTRTTGTSG